MSALATVTVTLHEVKGYVPPKPPTFGTEISRTFASSMEVMRDMGKLMVLAFVTFLPWGILAAVVGVPLWLTRRFSKSRGDAPQ